MSEERWFEQLADIADDTARAPAALKSRIYSAVMTHLADDGPLLDLIETKNTTGGLCVFEHALTFLPRTSGIPATNPCRICHARVLGERMDRAPIFWPGCPYAQFHQGSK